MPRGVVPRVTLTPISLRVPSRRTVFAIFVLIQLFSTCGMSYHMVHGVRLTGYKLVEGRMRSEFINTSSGQQYAVEGVTMGVTMLAGAIGLLISARSIGACGESRSVTGSLDGSTGSSHLRWAIVGIALSVGSMALVSRFMAVKNMTEPSTLDWLLRYVA